MTYLFAQIKKTGQAPNYLNVNNWSNPFVLKKPSGKNCYCLLDGYHLPKTIGRNWQSALRALFRDRNLFFRRHPTLRNLPINLQNIWSKSKRLLPDSINYKQLICNHCKIFGFDGLAVNTLALPFSVNCNWLNVSKVALSANVKLRLPFHVEEKDGLACRISWEYLKEQSDKRFSGGYFLRSNRFDLSEKDIGSIFPQQREKMLFERWKRISYCVRFFTRKKTEVMPTSSSRCLLIICCIALEAAWSSKLSQWVGTNSRQNVHSLPSDQSNQNPGRTHAFYAQLFPTWRIS